MIKISLALIGAGDRGMTAYAPYALSKPHEVEFVAVAEPDKQRRESFRQQHGISEEYCFTDYKELLDKPKLADAVLICTQDRMHVEPAMKALEKGYHVMLEKPMSIDPVECFQLGECAERYGRILMICHVLRYTPFFSTIKELLDKGNIGRLISIQHNENVGYWHQAHSYVRGNWRKSEEGSPMILAKSCHDLDIILWLAGSDCKRLSSFGTLTHFKAENAPEGAPKMCLQGCPAESECPYYAPKIYMTKNTGWPVSVITSDLSAEGRLKALREGPYGRCVYHCDNDVVDHQVVNMEFENEVTAVFTMCAFTNEMGRTIKLMGTEGEIRGHMEKNQIELIEFGTSKKTTIDLNIGVDIHGHGGGDEILFRDFINSVREGRTNALTSAKNSVQSHMMAFASERSRIEGTVINFNEYVQQIKSYTNKKDV
jgi:predicted dehydrogenase